MRINRLAWKGVLLLAALLLVGCSSSPMPPSAPSPSAGGAPLLLDVPQVTNPSSASVTIEDPFAIVRSDGPGDFSYGVGFLLRETSGRSSATIDRVVVYSPSGSSEVDFGEEFFYESGRVLRNACYEGTSDMLRVPAHGELDTFYTDAGAEWLVYCAPGAGGNIVVPALHVIVTFRDDSGVVGSVGAPISTLP